ncbi:LytTR family DNA-binding domain-containing protein [Tyzzerella sp. OttesenSCG-928-J15]|nr:LytTR family DNA-binding domain-containing protein [Tyzzerella sp. OttesenSCG-928-J15]
MLYNGSVDYDAWCGQPLSAGGDKMLGIVVSDDDRYTLELSSDIINECIKANDLDAKIVCMATNYNEIMVFLNNNPGVYLYFLDIDFGGQKLNGIDIARIIKKNEPMSKIVFVTSHADLSMRVLKSGIEPFGFIEKDFRSKEMALSYKKYILLAMDSPELMGHGDEPRGGTIKLPVGIDEYIDMEISRILYVESVKTMSHFVCYHSIDGSTISVRDTIENVLEKLGDNFMKSHRSVIINTNHVISVTEGEVNFSNGESAACSFRLRKEVIKRCIL